MKKHNREIAADIVGRVFVIEMIIWVILFTYFAGGPSLIQSWNLFRFWIGETVAAAVTFIAFILVCPRGYQALTIKDRRDR